MTDRTNSRKDAYAAAGVDVEAGAALIRKIAPLAKATARPGADAALGGFGGAFDLGALAYRDPLLISGADGVGTKLKIAQAAGRHDTIGVDLVAMCVNDVLAQGAEPLFFLDYFACGELEIETAAQVIAGIAEGCRRAGCALIGGETAEMPGMYGARTYDLAGFALGAVERDRILPRGDIAAGDALIGLPASGLHSNGFSLVRKIVETVGLSYDDPAPFAPDLLLGAALLAPTEIYVKAVLPLMQAGRVKAAAHITGGGLPENLPRALPPGLAPRLTGALPALPVFAWLEEAGGLRRSDLRRAFNCGVGYVLIVAAAEAAAILSDLEAAGARPFPLGDVAAAGDMADEADIG